MVNNGSVLFVLFVLFQVDNNQVVSKNFSLKNREKRFINQHFNPQGHNPYLYWTNQQNEQYSTGVQRCQRHWIQFQDSCYRFVRSPAKNRQDAQIVCQTYGSDLVNINSLEEYGFIAYQLLLMNYNYRQWYVGGVPSGMLANEEDVETANLQKIGDSLVDNKCLVFSYSPNKKKWGLDEANCDELLFYVCESQSGWYWVVDDRTHEFGVDVTDRLTVPRGPTFVQQPKDVIYDLNTKNSNNNVYLKCSANASTHPAPTFMWYKEVYENDQLIAELIDPLSDSKYTQSGGSLIISDPQQVDRGSYYCRVSNEFGTIRSETVGLYFGFVSEFNLKRSPETGKQHWGKAVFCDPPQHFPNLKYYWNREFFPNFVEEDQRVFVSHDGALYFSSIEQIDRGNYSCSVQTSVSSTGKNGPFFPITVHYNSNFQQIQFPNNFPKAFPEAPIAGKDLRLECIAFGYPVPKYKWTRKGRKLPRRAVLSNYDRVLTIPAATIEDQGEYICHAFNDYAATNSSVVVFIQSEPYYTIPLVDQHMDSNADLTWICEAFGIPDVSYQWLRNGEPLEISSLYPEDQHRYVIRDNILIIKNLNSFRDPGMYQCAASNSLKTTYSSAQLRVLAFVPTFKKNPLKYKTLAAEGGMITIKCSPEAAPRPTFLWKKDNNVISSDERRKIDINGDLLINPVTWDDEGMYSCTASNMYGTDESGGMLAVVRGPWWVQRLPPRVITSVFNDLTLVCEAASADTLEIAYAWTYNRMPISEYDSRRLRRVVEGGVLRIEYVQLMDAGDYECTVLSAVKQLKSSTLVIVEGPPGAPGGVQVEDVSKTTATIRWANGGSNGHPIMYYKILARTNWNATWSSVTNLVQAREYDFYSGRMETKIEGLSPWTTYEFRVAAVNELGIGPPSAPSPLYKTLVDSPYKAPSNVGGGGGKIGDLTITWDPLPEADQNAPGIFYKIFWRRKNSGVEFQSQELRGYKHTGIFVVWVEGSFYFTEYEVKVQAINEVGKGPESRVETVYSAEDMPQVAPQQVYSTPFNSTSLRVSWNPVKEQREIMRGRLIGYRLKYWPADFSEELALYHLNRDRDPTGLIVGLQPDTYYYVKVMAFNSAGEGPESERYMERTYRKAPQKPPSAVVVTGINPSTIKVVWRYVAPSMDEEPILGFKIRVWEADQIMSTATDTKVLIGTKLEGYVESLSPGKTYKMRVLAYSNGGDGRMSSPVLAFQMGDISVGKN